MKRVLLIVLIAIPSLAFATNYWPLDQGFHARYSCLEFPEYELAMDIVGEVDGWAEYRQFFYEYNEVVSQFSFLLSNDDDGNTWCTGQSLPPDGIDLLYWEPMIFIPGLLYAGLTWEGDIVVGGTPLHFEFEVLDEGPITVPAGTFYCYHVTRIWYYNDSPVGEVQQWFADGVGIVKQSHPGLDQPETYVMMEDYPIPTQKTTWGSMKALFR